MTDICSCWTWRGWIYQNIVFLPAVTVFLKISHGKDEDSFTVQHIRTTLGLTKLSGAMSEGQ